MARESLFDRALCGSATTDATSRLFGQKRGILGDMLQGPKAGLAIATTKKESGCRAATYLSAIRSRELSS